MKIYKIQLLFIIIVLFVYSCTKTKLELPSQQNQSQTFCDTVTTTYSAYIAPVFAANCATESSCHGAGSFNGDYTKYQDIKTDIDNGKIESIALGPNRDMPLGRTPTSDFSIEKIHCWISKGAQNN